MSTNKTGKYLKYAIGEIILVVIGILIALQINNWNQNRLNQIEEHNILANLHEEFKTNLETIKKIKTQHTMILQANKALLNYTRPNPDNFNRKSLDSLLGITMISPIFNYKNGALNSVISSGKLGLITNRELQNKIAQFPGIILDGTRSESTLREILIQKYIPHLDRHISVKDIFISSGIFGDKAPIRSEFDADFKSLLKSKEFENALMFNFGVMQVILNEYTRFENELNTVIALINVELQQEQ